MKAEENSISLGAEVAALSRHLRARSYNGDDSGPVWSFIDGGGVNSALNADPSRIASSVVGASLSNVLYLTWSELGGSAQIRVAAYNGSWTFIDGGGAYGINKSRSQDAVTPSLASFNSKLYCSWIEQDLPPSTVELVHVATWDGGTNWSFVEGSGTTGINNSMSADAESPFLLSANSSLYNLWGENAGGGLVQILSSVFNGSVLGPSWSIFGNNGANGANFNAGRAARNVVAAVLGTTLYSAWSEVGSSGKSQIRVAYGR